MNTNNAPSVMQTVGHGGIALVLVLFMLACVGIAFWKWVTGKLPLPNLKPVHIDGVLYSCIALFGFFEAYFSSDEAYKFFNPAVLFCMKASLGGGGALTGAVMMYRSSSNSDSVKDKSGVSANPPAPTSSTTPPAGTTNT